MAFISGQCKICPNTTNAVRNVEEFSIPLSCALVANLKKNFNF